MQYILLDSQINKLLHNDCSVVRQTWGEGLWGWWPAALHSSWNPAAESASKYAVMALVRSCVSVRRGLSLFVSGWILQ